MNIQVSEEWANAITVEHQSMRRTLEQIEEMTKNETDPKLREIYDIACLAVGTIKASAHIPISD
jgi:hypothetical protein